MLERLIDDAAAAKAFDEVIDDPLRPVGALIDR